MESCENQRFSSPTSHPVKKGLVTTPHPKKDFPRRTIESILKQAGLWS
ncbi:type II toxin-antitoxin system HicA family toxin [Acidaminobacter sp. JC074]